MIYIRKMINLLHYSLLSQNKAGSLPRKGSLIQKDSKQLHT